MSSDPSQWGEAHALFAVSCLELLCLFYGYRLRKVTWEQLWILLMECFSYGCAATVPEAQFRTLQLANGREIPWLRFMGWLLTCPVLLMGLVSIGTMTGTSTSVRLVPVLVANFVMILLGVTSATIDEPGVQRLIYALAVTAGGVVFMTAAQVFHSLYSFLCRCEKHPEAAEAAARARRVSVVLACSFFGGWVLFPIGFTLGPNFGRSISARGELLTFCFGDLLSKNIYVATMVVFKYYFLAVLSAIPEASADAEAPRDPSRLTERRPSQIIVNEMLGGAARVDRTTSPMTPTQHPEVLGSHLATPGTSPSKLRMSTQQQQLEMFAVDSTPAQHESMGPARDAVTNPPPGDALSAAAQAGYERGLREGSFHARAVACRNHEEGDDSPPESQMGKLKVAMGQVAQRISPGYSRRDPESPSGPRQQHAPLEHWQDRHGARSHREIHVQAHPTRGDGPSRSADSSPGLPPPEQGALRAQSAEAPPGLPRKKTSSPRWMSPCHQVARTEPTTGGDPALGRQQWAETSRASASSQPAAQQTPESVAIASAISAALATLDTVGGETEPERLSKALRYIAENPSIALNGHAARQ